MNRRRSRPILLWALFALQAICAVFFVGDAIGDAMGWGALTGFRALESFEFFMSIALIVGLVFTGRELGRMMTREKRMAQQIRAASGDFAKLIEEHFDDWDLTAAERDVALLAIKGFSIGEMAKIRNTAEGTIKAQNAAVYRKAGVSGRMQLLSLFVDELMPESLPKSELT